MEVGYIDHQVATLPCTSLASAADEDEQKLSSISMTATMDSRENLVLGMSSPLIISSKDCAWSTFMQKLYFLFLIIKSNTTKTKADAVKTGTFLSQLKPKLEPSFWILVTTCLLN